MKEKRRPLYVHVTMVTLAIFVFAITVLISFTSISSLVATKSTTLTAFERIATAASVVVQKEIDEIKSGIETIGMTAEFYRKSLSDTAFANYLTEQGQQHGYKSLYYTDARGKTGSGIDFSQYDFFRTAINGDTYMGTPQVSQDGSSIDMMVAAPVWSGGIQGSKTVGVVIAVMDAKCLSEIMNQVSVGETGMLYVIDEEGYTIALPEEYYEFVLERENTIQYSEEDPSLKDYANAELRALNGESVTTTLMYEGEECYLYATPLGNGWVLGGYATTAEFLSANIKTTIAGVILSLVFCVGDAGLIYIIIKKRMNPISQMAEVVGEIAKGNYDVEVNYTKNDEIGDMASALVDMLASTKTCIADVSRVLGAMAEGDFSVTTNAEYRGVFNELGTATEKITKQMRAALTTVRNAADNVSAGADQVAAGAHALSQGATEQASAVEELTATLSEVTNTVRSAAQNADEANRLAVTANEEAQLSNQRMHELRAAMQAINETSGNIQKIIKEIDDIAFQTNILALNAAVEAARAGSAGKGFSVVADEVRSLASKSADAAKSTAVFIEESLQAVATGMKTTEVTAAVLEDVTKKMSVVSERITDISTAANEQASSLEQLSVGMEQVSAVVQTNSATSEQSAAASETLTSQSAQLMKVVSQFRM